MVNKSILGAACACLTVVSFNVSAAPPQVPLTVTVQGDGVVTSEPAGITCPSDCDESYKKNTSVTLTATADPNSSFLGWSGACVGTDPVCVTKLTAPTVVAATFDTATVIYPAPVPQTGRTHCVDAIGLIDCAGTGQDGDLQAGVALPTPRFTDNSDGTVTDNLTGLRWLKDAACLGHHSWADGFDVVARLNSGTEFFCTDYLTGTFADWRVANINELHSLVTPKFSPPFSNSQGDAPWSEGDPFVNLPVDQNLLVRSSTYTEQTNPVSGSILHLSLTLFSPGDVINTGSEAFPSIFLWAVRDSE